MTDLEPIQRYVNSDNSCLFSSISYLVEKSNAEALALAIKKYIDNPELIARHGKNARTKVLNKFNEKHMVQAYLEQYQALVKG